MAAAQSAISIIEKAEDNLRQKDRKLHGLCVDAASPFLFHQIIPHLASFKEAYPKIEVELTSNEAYSDLIKSKIDIAIRIGALKDSSLIAKPLGKSHLTPSSQSRIPEKTGHSQKPLWI